MVGVAAEAMSVGLMFTRLPKRGRCVAADVRSLLEHGAVQSFDFSAGLESLGAGAAELDLFICDLKGTSQVPMGNLVP